ALFSIVRSVERHHEINMPSKRFVDTAEGRWPFRYMAPPNSISSDRLVGRGDKWRPQQANSLSTPIACAWCNGAPYLADTGTGLRRRAWWYKLCSPVIRVH